MADIRVVIQKPISGGGGAVDSVNGKQGVVVLYGTDIELVDGGGVTVTQAISDLDTDDIENSSTATGATQTDVNDLFKTTIQNNAIDIFGKADKATLTQDGGNVTGSIDTDANTFSLTSDSGVESVVAGANVEVNNVDPKNPIVSAFPTTTAGILSRTYFTGETVTTSEGTFYKSDRDGKGNVATATQTINIDDNEKGFFTQDLLSDPFPIDTVIYAGAYSGVLNGLVSSNGGEQKFYVEIYKTDINGSPIASGITGSPVGDLGVTVVAIAESGLIDLRSGDETQFSITATLTENLSLLSTNLIRYHVAAEKIGTTGGAVDISTSYGFNHVSHLDIPVQVLTNTVINSDSVEFSGLATQFDINRSIKENKIEADDYATFDTGGTLKARLDGSILYLTNNGTDA